MSLQNFKHFLQSVFLMRELLCRYINVILRFKCSSYTLHKAKCFHIDNLINQIEVKLK